MVAPQQSGEQTQAQNIQTNKPNVIEKEIDEKHPFYTLFGV